MPAYEVITGPSPWPARYTFSPAVRAGNLLFISGMTAGDESGKIVGPGDIAAQTRYIFEKFWKLLAAAGGGFEHIVQTTEYVTTTSNFPTATGVVVAGLLREGALIEISAIAVLPDPPPLPSGERAG
jgi:aminoacrylate peracid reductase